MLLPQVRYQPLGPVLAGEGSRAFLGLEVAHDGIARPVVLVWVPDELVQKPELVEVIRRETEHAATLEHPNILRVHGFASLEDGHARITEFADGESLRKVLEVSRRLPAHLAARVAADAAMGVHFAHLAGNDDGAPLIHGDLRPETVIISFRGVTKVSGYGALQVAPRELYGNRVTGRRTHSAPEQIIGGRTNILPQTDVYLLGLLLYECISGVVPFTFEPDFDQAVLSQSLPRLPETELPAPLWRVIEKATSKKATDRYITPLAFRDALEEALEGLPGHDELARFLNSHFPESNSVRTARRREIDAGIADLARRQWADAAASHRGVTAAPARNSNGNGNPARAPLTRVPNGLNAATDGVSPAAANPSPQIAHATSAATNGTSAATTNGSTSAATNGSTSAATNGTSAAAMSGSALVTSGSTSVARNGASSAAPAAPPRAAARYVPEEPISDFHPIRSRIKPLPVLVGVTLLVAAVAMVMRPSRSLPNLPTRPAKTVAATPPPPAVAPPEVVPTEAIAAPAPSDPPVEVKVEQQPVEPTSLSLDVDPPVDVTIAGQGYGRSPVNIPLSPGRYVVQLVDRSKGISTTRTVVIGESGKTSEQVVLSKGYVTVSAPEGAEVFIDGRTRGRAPLEGELAVYEGSHKILVMVGKAKWQQPFSLRSGERMYFNVETQ